MRRTVTAIFVAALTVASLSMGLGVLAAEPPTAPIGDVDAGRFLAGKWCSGCHVTAESRTGRATDGAPPFAVIAIEFKRTPDEMRGWLSHGHTDMPDFNLSRSEMDDLIAYILSLRPGKN